MAGVEIGEFTGFPGSAFAFYRGLAEDNSKAYFDEHRDVYDHEVRLPMEELLAAVADTYGDNAKVFRPNRDVRFSKDKSPYKDHIGAVLREGEGRPVLYVQLNGEGMFAATGYYWMSRDQLERFYAAIDDDRKGTELEGLVAEARDAGLDVGGSQLKTGPRGYAKDHPRIELLRHKHLTTSRTWPEYKWMQTREALRRITATWEEGEPINAWLEQHVGPPRETRDERPK